MFKKKNLKFFAALLITLACGLMFTCPAFAKTNTDVAGAVTSAYTTYMQPQIKDIFNNVIFRIIDIALVAVIIIRAAMSGYSYKHNGNQFEWHILAILVGGLIISLTAPLWIWNLIK